MDVEQFSKEIAAWKNGATIQSKPSFTDDEEWRDDPAPRWYWAGVDYRIKPGAQPMTNEENREHTKQMLENISIDKTLEERGSRYGIYKNQAFISQSLKVVMRAQSNYHVMDADMKESLDLIANKIGRILNGDPNYHDSWHDIAGYAKLVADRLLGIEK